MTRLVIVLDVDENPELVDPHEAADDLLNAAMPSFAPNTSFHVDGYTGRIVSAEWEK